VSWGDLALAHPVDPRVTDVADVRLVAGDQARHDRGAHALVADVAARGLEDPQVGELDRAHQAVLDIGQRPVHLVGPGDVLVLAGALVELPDGLGGHLGGDLARGVAPHPVGDDEQLFVLDQREVILVVGPFHPHVGLGGVADLHGADQAGRSWRSRENIPTAKG
jgi:hypothetical protein